MDKEKVVMTKDGLLISSVAMTAPPYNQGNKDESKGKNQWECGKWQSLVGSHS